jgi:hypothetical protein
MAAMPPPGWYTDPWQVAPWRWWDGMQWTPAVWPPSPVPGGYAQVTGGYSQAAGQLDVVRAHHGEQRLFRFARAALCLWGLVDAANFINVVAEAHSLRQAIDQATASGNGQIHTLNLNGATAAVDLLSLVSVGLAVAFLVWQYRAATVARSLGRPARLSPGLGVGSWFIPVVNLWFPYWALRDLLPPAHPLRPWALRAWLAYIATSVLAITAFVVALFSTVAGVVLILLAAGSMVAAISIGWRLMAAVHEDQQAALDRG